MPRRKRKRTGVKPLLPKPPPQPTPRQHTLTAAITNLNRFVTLIAGIPLLYIFYDLPNIIKRAFWLNIVCLGLYNIILAFKFRLNFKARNLGLTPIWEQPAHLEFRRYVVTLLGLSFFSNVVVLMPILYVQGYITRLAALLPSKEQLGSNVSLALAFGAGAIVSGILGNLSYDLLKLVYRKMRE